MRNHLFFYINGQPCRVHGEEAFVFLSDYLREIRRLVGTKIVCAEGDCGACTVLVGKPNGDQLHYQAITSCITQLFQLDGKHVVTIEGIPPTGQLTALQQNMIDSHGSQCGFCTPGIVMNLTGAMQDGPIDDENIKSTLIGNLCRCTGYVSILDAARAAGEATAQSLTLRYPATDFAQLLGASAAEPVQIDTEVAYPGVGPRRRCVFVPRTLAQALTYKAEHPEAVIVAGNTQLGVIRGKGLFDAPDVLCLSEVHELAEIREEDGTVYFGANVTLEQFEQFTRDRDPEWHQLCMLFAGPQTRSLATLVGNVVNGSPIADVLAALYVSNAVVYIAGQNGDRSEAIEQFLVGYKKTTLQPHELVTGIRFTPARAGELFKLYKVSKRKEMDVATFRAGFRLRVDRGMIQSASIAYGGVGPMVRRMKQTEAFLTGQAFREQTFREAGAMAVSEIAPISDVYASREYRLQLAKNILVKFYFDCGGA